MRDFFRFLFCWITLVIWTISAVFTIFGIIALLFVPHLWIYYLINTVVILPTFTYLLRVEI